MEFYTFGLGQTCDKSVEVLGGKGYGLVWMSNFGINVPPGFIIPPMVWADYDKKPKGTLKEISKEIKGYLLKLKKHFGYDPLLSVRSGARVSMPGLMDTILNVGLDNTTNKFWREKLGDKCWANSLHRLITMYGSVANGISREELEKGNFLDALKTYERKTASTFPNAFDQILGAVEAVFKSWDNERALIYRKLHNIPREWGTTVVIQAMVFGNLNDQSGTGVLFTRNPDTGEKKVTGEFLINGQGEDVVAGIRTPLHLDKMVEWNPAVAAELEKTVLTLEQEKKDMQDVEFTIQDGKLYFLQTRNGKRSAQAAIRIALEMKEEGLIFSSDVAKRVTNKQIDQLQIPHIDPSFTTKPVFTGIGACSGIVTGKPVFSSADAINCKEPCILISKETTPEDLGGMLAAVGVITMEGGLTSHAAVLCRGENKPCVVGVGVDVSKFNTPLISFDGSTGNIWFEKIPLLHAENKLFSKFWNVVQETTSVIPVITEVPKEQMKVALFHVGLESFKDIVTKVLYISSKVEKLYLDFSLTEENEKVFFSLFSVSLIQSAISELEKNFYLLNEKIVIIGDVKTKFKKLSFISDIRDLILSDGEFLYSSDMVNDKAIEWVIKKKKEDGVGMNPILLGNYSPSIKSICSLEQVLNVVQSNKPSKGEKWL